MYVSNQRALLTETEREILTGDRDVSDNYRYTVRSRVRHRLQVPLGRDVGVLREHDTELYELVRAAVLDPTTDTTDTGDADLEPPGVDVDALRDRLAGSGRILDARVDAILTMYDTLQEQGTASRRDLIERIDADACGYANEHSLWSNMVKGKNTLQALPGVESPGEGRSTWVFRLDD